MENENISAKWFAERILETSIALFDCITNKDFERAIVLNENLYELSSKLEKVSKASSNNT